MTSPLSEKKGNLKNIGGFDIIGTVGKGGMGDVYKARQISLNRIVALKLLPAELSRNEEFSKRFASEAKVVSKLEHQNIVTIYDYGTENSIRYLAMQYIEGENLGDKIAREKKLKSIEAVEIAKRVARALKYAHDRRVLHRDIKPQNILMGINGQV
ncbi:MAG: serine/threonine-protein kinase, partial [bacterium]